ncbi:MAG TPA: indole-3-glycerol phosphate synthase TrpC [Chitinophagales bacterium]|nr:indole-3-glycerol phosphate synthase TrpC [Chitinophagales bacterium]
MSILHKIVDQKRLEIASAQKSTTIESLKEMPLFYRPTISMSQRIMEKGSSGIIAEFKRHSPSKKWINQNADPVEVVKAYAEAGVAGSSVLTDEQFFKGSLDDLVRVREAVDIPILRKDFIVDPYQIYEAKANGADVILLIASILTPCEVSSLADIAHQIGLEVLLELHDEAELGHVNSEIEMIGINNRNLNTFEVDIEQSARMVAKLDVKYIKIAESGIDSPETISYFREFGFNGFLIGENFMKTSDPGLACKKFIQSI